MPPTATPSPPGHRTADRHGTWTVLAAVAVGGGIGSAARYGAGLLWPTPEGTFPWTTLSVNASGCLLIGLFLTGLTTARREHRLLRPLVSTGLLGGFTTFSTYTVEVRDLLAGGHTGTALGYLAATVAAALAGVWSGSATARAVAVRRRRGGRP
ncbi:fluoride efflux transporter CrcB [Allostreptomyces psammosilenae]|uniref:Fluoride-specific ion channel FluC n=1 Tax=Allostreptomyces psammosilenae TaxID=1892865 RepID=A0A852ZWN2_9ACTN|nr:fluoride efflux transporter CrcB [Allostreptomyces psammosilenae]NYI06385.1 CrcB protein [Allostreptomyces psammosilenae]